MKILTYNPIIPKGDPRDSKSTKPGETNPRDRPEDSHSGSPGETRQGNRSGGSIDFESFFSTKSKINASNRGSRGQGDVVDKITIENRLASQGAAVEDVGLAGSLLNTLVSQIKASQAESLQHVHNLEGILYYYRL
jgi:hypothetical protein